MIELLIIISIIFFAYIIDGRIRKRLYVTDVNLAKIEAKKEFGTKSQAFEAIMNKGWQGLVSMNNNRHGIIGDLDYDIKPTDKYGGSGERTFVGTGIVLDKQFVSRGDIVNDMAVFYQKNKKAFIADPKELRDRHIVVMYIQDNMNQFIWEDKDLYDNVEKGEKVSISYNEKGPLYIGYKLRGEQNDPNPKKKLDVGRNQKIS
jgi:hypothetical protein